MKNGFALSRVLVVSAMAVLSLGMLTNGAGAITLAAPNQIPRMDTESLPPGVTVQTVLSGMNLPVAMAFDPQGRLFYTEKVTGNVRLFANGVLQPQPVITYNVGSCSERGLLGIAIDPNFNSNHFIYVYYTQGPGCGATQNKVARFVENNGVGSNSVDIFASPQTAGNHDGVISTSARTASSM